MFENWISLDDYAEQVKSEAGFIFGYKRLFDKAGLDDEVLAQGLKITAEANRIRQGVYRHLVVREDLRAELNGQLAQGLEPDAEKVKKLQKVEDQIFSAAYHVIKLRQPLDNFLFEIEMNPRNRYNVKDDSLEDSDYGAGY